MFAISVPTEFLHEVILCIRSPIPVLGLSDAVIAYCNESRRADHISEDGPRQQRNLGFVLHKRDLVGVFDQGFDHA